MSNNPHRPFVPKHTPPERAGQRPPGDFRVVRPFVHGQARSYQPEAPVVAPPKAPVVVPPKAPVAETKPVASIADFLAMDVTAPAPVPEFQGSGSPASIADYLAGDNGADTTAYEAESDSYELPPIEHFTDTVSEEDTPSPEAFADSFMDPFGAPTEQTQADPHGWEETDWQRYDWSAAGALGEAGDPAANSAWAQTDWGRPGGTTKDSRDSAAKAIADALDGIARRIRDGDLVIPPPPAAVPDPATIAATLAALLGVRR